MGLTDEKYLALMFSFSRNSPLDLMTPEYGCCLRKKSISSHSDVLSVVLLCWVFFLFVWFFHTAQLSALGKVLSSALEQK